MMNGRRLDFMTVLHFVNDELNECMNCFIFKRPILKIY